MTGLLLPQWAGGPIGGVPQGPRAANVRTTSIGFEEDGGLLAIALEDGVIQGTWRLALSLGGDVEGTVVGDLVSFTFTSPGLESASVTASVQEDGSWVGTIDGSGFYNEPFEAQAAFFP